MVKYKRPAHLVASPISKIDDFVKHVYREHNQETDLWADIGAEGQKHILTDVIIPRRGRW